MKNSKLLQATLLGCCALTMSACNDDESKESVQIDRVGRAGVNTAITDPFFRTSVAAEQTRHDDNASDYNGNADPDSWNSSFNTAFQGTLAILDSLDRNCGNQLIADGDAEDRYNLLATVLTDDRLYVNTASGSCQQYLAVEGNAVGITNSDCGGRTPLHDVIDTTYSALAIGALTGVGDGVDFDATGTPSLDTFPFLAPPQVEVPEEAGDTTGTIIGNSAGFELVTTIEEVTFEELTNL